LFCYFHHRLQKTHKNYRRPSNWATVEHIVLNPLEDRDAVQMAISQVVNAIAVGQLAEHRVLLLKGLQIASLNLRRNERESPLPTEEIVRHATQTIDGVDIVDLTEIEIDPPSLDPLDYEDEDLDALPGFSRTPTLLS
jgi:hypothetical protein